MTFGFKFWLLAPVVFGASLLFTGCGHQENLNGAFARVNGGDSPAGEAPVRLFIDRHHLRVTRADGEEKVKWIHVEREGRDFVYKVLTGRRGDAVGSLAVVDEDHLAFMGHRFQRAPLEDHERPVR